MTQDLQCGERSHKSASLQFSTTDLLLSLGDGEVEGIEGCAEVSQRSSPKRDRDVSCYNRGYHLILESKARQR
jgi:hypothetical protein